MRTLLVLLGFTAQMLIVNCKVIPDYLPQPCSKSNPNFTDCTLHTFNKLGPYLLKGIPEFNTPSLDPLHISLFVANKSFDQCANFSFTMRDAKICGFNTTYIKNFTYDTEEMQGQLDLHVAYMRVKAEYEIVGRISSYTARNSGFWEGNTTGIDVSYRFSLKIVERDGVKYYTTDDFDRDCKIQDGHIKMTSKNPDYQFAADTITNFFNEDPKRASQIGNILFRKNAASFYKSMIDQVLAKIPADELIPE